MTKWRRIPKAEARNLYRDGRPVYIMPAEPRRITKRDRGPDGVGDFDSRANQLHATYKSDLTFYDERD